MLGWMAAHPGIVAALRLWGVGVLVADVWLLRLLQRHALGPEARWYMLAAAVVLAANASLLAVTATRGDARLRASPRWPLCLAGLATAVFLAGCWARARHLADCPLDVIPDMHRVMAIGADRLIRGEFPYRPVEVPWRTFMVYQPGMLLPYAVPAALGLDVRWTAVVASALIPALWLAVLGRRGPATLIVLAPVAVAWLLETEQQTLPAVIHDPAWWPWLIGGSLLFLHGRWGWAGVLLGAAAASRQHAAGLAILLFCHAWRRAGRRPALALGVAAFATAVVLYLPFVAVDWRSVLIQPLRTYHEVMVQFVIPKRPEWIRESMGWSSWLITLPGYYRWVLPVQLAITTLIIAGATRWVRSRAGAVVCGALALMVFVFFHDWPVWYLHVASLLLVATGTLDAACTSLTARGAEPAGTAAAGGARA